MVEPDTDLIINSEASQTVFEGTQKLLQPPPEEPVKKVKRKTPLIIGLITVGLLTAAVLGAAFSQSNRTQSPAGITAASPSPTPIFIDQAKEMELQRIETMVKTVDPEALLVMPPQVDMAVQF